MGVLEGKVAIITGAAGGQGAAQSRLFVKEGAQLVLTDISDEGRALAETLGEGTRFMPHDVSSEQQWDDVVETAMRTFGRLDILVNNAGIYHPQSLQDTSPEAMQRHYCVNQLGPFLGMRAVIKGMRQGGGGNIVNIGSGLGLRAAPGNFAYASSKWALRGMTKCAALDLACYNIRVNAVLPGLVETAMLAAIPQEVLEAITSSLPIKRLAQADEIAHMVLFLASDASAFMTGADIPIDGGGSL